MLKIARKRFLCSFRIHIFVILQLGIVLSIACLMVSSVYSRFAYYLPLQNLMNQNASAVQLYSEIPGSDMTKPRTVVLFQGSDVLSKAFPDKAHTWYVRYKPLMIPTEKTDRKQELITYSENTWSLYVPKMAAGSWSDILSSGLTENGNIPVIAYQYNTDYKIGDTVEVEVGVTDEGIFDTMCLEICGFLDSEAMLFGGAFGEGLHNHTSFYQPAVDLLVDPLDEDTEGTLFVMSQDLVDSLGISASISSCNGIITYDDDISQEQVVLHTEQIRSITGFPAENIASIKDFSLLYIMQQVYALMPLFVCITILALISSLCTSAVITKQNLHSYAIFHLCGATSGKCVQICLLQELLVSFAAILLTSCIIAAASKMLHITVQLHPYSFLLCAVILVLHLLLTSMLSMHMLRGGSLKKHLQRERS